MLVLREMTADPLPIAPVTLGDRLRDLLDKKGLTVAIVAERLQKSGETVRNYLKADDIKESVLDELSTLLGTTNAYLRYGIRPTSDEPGVSGLDMARWQLNLERARFEEESLERALTLKETVVFIYELSTNAVSFFGATNQLFGAQKNALGDSFDDLLGLFDRDDRKKMRDGITNAITSSNPITIEATVKWPGGIKAFPTSCQLTQSRSSASISHAVIGVITIL